MLLLLVAFVVLLGMGICAKDLDWRQAGWFIFLVFVAWEATTAFASTPYPFFAAVGALDVVLVLMDLHGDVDIH